MNTKNLGFNSKLIHAGDYQDEFGSPVTPIYQTSTFAFKSAQHGADLFAGKEKGYIYTRIGNPTIEVLENKLAEEILSGKFSRGDKIKIDGDGHRFHFEKIEK